MYKNFIKRAKHIQIGTFDFSKAKAQIQMQAERQRP